MASPSEPSGDTTTLSLTLWSAQTDSSPSPAPGTTPCGCGTWRREFWVQQGRGMQGGRSVRLLGSSMLIVHWLVDFCCYGTQHKRFDWPV